jgi:hypothetical protein
MRDGYDVIHQGCFLSDESVGYPDFLIKIDEPSDLGTWSYEVHDAKLGGHPRPAYIFQLLFYTDQLERLQGRRPERMHLILGNDERPGFSPGDFEAYAARVRAAFLERQAQLEAGAEPAYPYPVAECASCPWWRVCVDKRRAEDHISLVANLQRRQGLRIEAQAIHDIPSLAGLDEAAVVPKLSKETLANLRAHPPGPRGRLSGHLRGRSGADQRRELRRAAHRGHQQLRLGDRRPAPRRGRAGQPVAVPARRQGGGRAAAPAAGRYVRLIECDRVPNTILSMNRKCSSDAS